ncbi:MAG: trimeric intracellular cation channel family protein [Actinomycetes bacterium]
MTATDLLPDAGTLLDSGWPLRVLDLVGVFVFALSGGLAAVRKRFDVFGVLALAVAAGLGGGILRDVLIGAVPPVGISDWRLVAVACAAGVVTFFFHPRVSRIRRTVLVLDAVGLGFFVVAGTLKALGLGTTAPAAVLVGVLTGIGGGSIRDLLSGEVPQVLARDELYALPALVGALALAVTWTAGVRGPLVTAACVLLVIALRVTSLRLRLRAPAPRGLEGPPPDTMDR